VLLRIFNEGVWNINFNINVSGSWRIGGTFPTDVNSNVEGKIVIAGTGANPVNEVLNDKGLSNTIALLVSPDNDNVWVEGSTVLLTPNG